MINIVLQALFTNVIYYIAMCNLSRMQFPKLQILLVITISTILSLFLSPTLGGLGNLTIICSALFFLLLQTKDLLLSFCYSAFSTVILFVANTFGAFAFYVIFGNDSVINHENPLHICLLYGISGIVAYVVSKYLGILFQKRLRTLFAQINRKYIIYIFLGGLFVLLFFYYQFFIARAVIVDPTINAAIGVAFSVAYLVILLVAVNMFISGVKKSIETAHKQELLSQLQNYTSNLESTYVDMRKFRHDYMNIISALYGYIGKKDLEGLEQYFTNSIVPIEKRIECTNSTLDRLKNIHILEIKGLAALKLIHAQELGASIHIEVHDEISSVNFDIVNLTRIIGIFIDNALEACLETESKVLQFAFLIKNNIKVMIIANSFHEPLPSITDMYKDGFSTKGEQRGLGLYTVRQIVDQSDFVVLNTYIENDLFIQELKLLDN